MKALVSSKSLSFPGHGGFPPRSAFLMFILRVSGRVEAVSLQFLFLISAFFFCFWGGLSSLLTSERSPKRLHREVKVWAETGQLLLVETPEILGEEREERRGE